MAELALNYDDEDFSPDPPSWEEIEFDYTIESILGLLNQAARGENLAWALSSAMSSIMSRCGRRNAPRPNDRQRDRLLAAITAAYLTADRTLPPLSRRSRIFVGMEALAGIVAYWAAADEQRATWLRDAYSDMYAYARIFRNELHNLSLAEEIEERAEKRRSSVIVSLLANTSHDPDTVKNDV
jgi:signal transduction histidine kinase